MQPLIGTVHIVTVAVGSYPASSGLPQIPTAIDSAREIEALFKTDSPGRAVRLWNTDGCRQPLLNLGATKANIIDCLKQVQVIAKPEDMAVLFFMGHGGTTKNTELFYFYPGDYSASSIDDSQSAALSSAELADVIRYFKTRRLVLILDTCDSGVGLEPLASVAEAAIREELATAGSEQAG